MLKKRLCVPLNHDIILGIESESLVTAVSYKVIIMYKGSCTVIMNLSKFGNLLVHD